MPKPRKSEAWHKLTGIKANHGQQKTMSEDHTAAAPRMPSHLSPAARKEWKRVLPLLLERGSVTEADAGVLSLHCEVYGRWVEAKQDVAKNGLTITSTVLDRNGEQVSSRKVNPALKVAQDYERSLRSSLRELGLTPASREKVLRARPIEEKPKSAWDIINGADDK